MHWKFPYQSRALLVISCPRECLYLQSLTWQEVFHSLQDASLYFWQLLHWHDLLSSFETTNIFLNFKRSLCFDPLLCPLVKQAYHLISVQKLTAHKTGCCIMGLCLNKGIFVLVSLPN